MSKVPMPANGGGDRKGAPDGVSASPGDGDRGVHGRTEGGESGGGAYPNPHTSKTPPVGAFSGGQTDNAYYGGGQAGEQGGDAPNAATADSSNGTEEGSTAWTAPTYAPHLVHAEGRSFEVQETNGIAEAEAGGKVGTDAPYESEQSTPGSN